MKKYPYLILIALCLIIYANSLTGEFVSDDIDVIVKNPLIANPGNYLLHPANLILSLNYQLGKLNPFSYHLTNVILHSVNTILVFILLGLFFSKQASLAGAVIFAVHPIHTEAVAWVTGASYLVIGFFTLVTYLLYYHATYLDDTPKKKKITFYLLALLVFSYFIYSQYSFFALVPFLLILSDITFKKWKKNWRLWAPFFIILMIRLALLKAVFTQRVTAMGEEMYQAGVSSVQQGFLLKAADSLFSHFWLLLWPAKLTLYHQGPLGGVYFYIHTYGLTLLALALLGLIIAFYKNKRIFFAAGIFVIFLAPTFSPVSVSSTIAERYLYVPSIFLSICVSYFYEASRSRSRGIALSVMVMIALLSLAYAVRTYVRNEDYRTQERFWMSEVRTSPASWKARNNLGVVLKEKGRIQAAISAYEKAIALNPLYPDPYNNLAIIYHENNEPEKAIALLKKTLKLNQEDAITYFNLGAIYAGVEDYDEAITHYEQAIHMDPGLIEPYINASYIYIKQGNYAKAIDYLEAAIDKNPYYINAYNNLAVAYQESGRIKDAINVYEKAARLGLEVPRAYLESLKKQFFD